MHPHLRGRPVKRRLGKTTSVHPAGIETLSLCLQQSSPTQDWCVIPRCHLCRHQKSKIDRIQLFGVGYLHKSSSMKETYCSAKNITTVLSVLFIMSLFIWFIRDGSSPDIYTFPVPPLLAELSAKRFQQPTGVFQEPVPGANHLFFVESSCALGPTDQSMVLIKPRQACALESAAKTNPNMTIYYLDTCLAEKDYDGSLVLLNPLLKELFHYNNIRLYHINMKRYLVETGLEGWLLEGHLNKSHYPIEHASDVLRLVTLWKYGGVYLDLDMVVIRNLSKLGLNFVVAESENYLGNSILSYSWDGFGHNLVGKCLEEVRRHFKGTEWSFNGPYLITRVLQQECGVSVPSETNPGRCKGFIVHNPKTFFPLPYQSWSLLFDETSSNATMAKLLANSTYTVHAWNKLSHDKQIMTDSKQPYSLLASTFCPRVYNISRPVF
uniref:Alpha 1,4-glycosyltransferase domain-containing protein n=1 Tax=Timema tahoe TaxID=61484 RepID=A0A7R9IF89_9NEOP|nr:unnamed protein product [Timema tahoe]